MKLNEEQIQSLYKFTKDHFVDYYDLQTELVDHLANIIEATWEENPKVSFEYARDKAFKSFGVFGFSNIVEKRERSMSKRYFKYFWTELKQWFGLPKIIATTALFAIFYTLFSLPFYMYFLFVFYAVLLLWSLYKIFKLNRAYKIKKKVFNKIWLLEDLIFKQVGGISILIVYQTIQILSRFERFVETKYFVGIASVLFTLMYLLNYISLELLPNKSEKLLEETYPEYRFETK